MNRRKEEKQSKLFNELFEEDNASLERDPDSLTFDEAFQRLENDRTYYEGVEASIEKRPVTDNPYPKYTNNHHSWFHGWNDQSKGIARYKPGIDL